MGKGEVKTTSPFIFVLENLNILLFGKT